MNNKKLYRLKKEAIKKILKTKVFYGTWVYDWLTKDQWFINGVILDNIEEVPKEEIITLEKNFNN